MNKKILLFIFLIIVLLLIIINVINLKLIKQEAGLTFSYTVETDQITVYVIRPSNKHKPYEYEYRLDTNENISLVSRDEKDGTDVFVFDIIDNGVAELAFYSIDPKDLSNKYKNAYELKISITDNAVNLNNKLFNRNKSN